MFDQPAAGLHQPLLQTGKRPVLNPLRHHQTPPQVSQVVGQQAQRQAHPGTVSRSSYTRTRHQFAAGPLQTEPENIGPRATPVDSVKTCMKRDFDRPEIEARVFSEESSEVPSSSRRCLRTRLTPGWILTGRRRRSSSVLTHRSTRASVGILPRVARHRATWLSEAQEMPPSMCSLSAAPNSLSESTKPIKTLVSRASTS